jgi:hypothetical protein
MKKDHLKYFNGFTQEECEQLIIELNRVKPKPSADDINYFIDRLEVICEQYKGIKYKSKKDRRDELKDMLRSFTSAKKHLKKIAKLRSVITFPERIHVTGVDDRIFEGLDWPFLTTANNILDELEVLENGITEKLKRLKKPGRPKGDHAALIQSVIILFSQYIGSPKLEPDGPLDQIIKITRKALGLRFKWIDRSLKDAVQQMKKHPNEYIRHIISK